MSNANSQTASATSSVTVTTTVKSGGVAPAAVGGIAGGIVGGFVLLGLALLYFVTRRPHYAFPPQEQWDHRNQQSLQQGDGKNEPREMVGGRTSVLSY